MPPELLALVILIPLVSMVAPNSTPKAPRPVTVPFELKSNLIVLNTRVNGRERRLVLDTGASQTMLDTKAAAELHVDPSERRVARGAGGDIEVALAPLKSVDVGDARVENLTCIVSDVSGIAEKLGGGIDGVLGFDFLSRFTVTIDYAARKLTLQPYAAAPAAAPRIDGHTFTHPASGLTVTRPTADWDFVTETRYPQIILSLQRRGDAAVTVEFQVQELHGLTLDQVWPDVRQSLNRQFDDYQEISTAQRKLDSHAARQIDFTGSQNGKRSRERLVAMMQDGRLWTVTCTATPETFPATAKDFDEILNHCRLEAPSH